MPITQGESTTASVIDADHVTIDLPTSRGEDLLVAIITGGGLVSPPSVGLSGWNSIVGQSGAVLPPYNLGISAFWRTGGLVGSVDITAAVVCDQLSAAIFVLEGTTSTSPISGTNSETGGGSGFSLSCTTTEANEFVFTVFAGTLGIGNNVGMTDELFHGDARASHLSIAAGLVGGIRHNAGSGSASGAFIPHESGLYVAIAFGVKPFLGPTDSSVVFPNGNESLIAGANVALRCTAASSPIVAASTLQYEFSYSAINGGGWSVIGLSSAGVASKIWAVPSILGGTNLIRVRSYDPVNTIYSLGYDESDDTFSIIAETTPAVAIITPIAGSIQVKSATLLIAWSYSGGAANPQTQFTLQWSRDYFVSHTAVVGPTSQATQNTTIDVSGEADGATISIRVKAQGLSIYSAYSPVVSFVIASVPSAPNITAPTAGSPPISATQTVTFTSGDFIARRFRVVRSGSEVYNAAVNSNALSFSSPYAFGNGITVTIYLSVQNQYGLWGAEDSETVTPAYTGPTKPTVVYTLNAERGYIRATITNSGTVTSNELWRRENGQAKGLAIGISPSTSTVFIPANGQFEDHAVASGVGYIYFVRTYNGPVYTDSDDSPVQSIVLTDVWLHAVSRTNVTNNVLGVPVHMPHLIGSGGHSFAESQITLDLLGRDEPGAIFGEAIWEKQAITTFFRFSEQAMYDALLALREATRGNAGVLLIRDSLSNRFYCKMADLETSIENEGYDVSFIVEESDYVESLI